MSEEEKTRKETIGRAYDYQIALAEESDRAAAILAAAYFEDRLRDAIKTGARLVTAPARRAQPAIGRRKCDPQSNA